MNKADFKRIKYSGTKKIQPGYAMVYMPDGTVKWAGECFAGFATNNNSDAHETKEVEFYYKERQKK